MSGFLLGLLALSAKGALVAAVVALVTHLGRDHLPARLTHALWLLVPARLALPVLPESSFSLFRLTPSLSSKPGTWLPAFEPLTGPGTAAMAGNETGVPVDATMAGLSTLGGLDLVIAALLALWALGVLAHLARGVVAGVRLRRALDDPRRTRPVTDAATLALLEDCRGRLGLDRPVRLVESDIVGGPAVHGWRRPTLLLPRGSVREPDPHRMHHLRMVFLHELVHVRHGDGPVRTLTALIAALHWFNPFVHLALRRLETEAELACDAAVLARLAPGERTGYGRSLLRTATTSRRPDSATSAIDHRAAALVGMAVESERALERRLTMITRFRPPSRRHLPLLAALFVVLALVCLTDLPAQAGPHAQSDDQHAQDHGQNAQGHGEHARNHGDHDHDASAESLARVRTFGVAMYRWAETNAPATVGTDAPELTVIDWSDCEPIPYAEARRLLTPTTATGQGENTATLMQKDAWGHELELCLDRKGDGTLLYGVRSPGADGVFDGERYEPGPFPAADTDRDLVWVNGFFVQWPTGD